MNEGLRKAALAVASLDPEDRAWLLAQLDDGDRELLEEVLARNDGVSTPSSPGQAEEGGSASSAGAGQGVWGGVSPAMRLKGMPSGGGIGIQSSSSTVAGSDTSAFARLQDQLASAQRGGPIGAEISTASEAGTQSASWQAAGFSAGIAGASGSTSARQRLIDAQSREVFILLSGEPDWMVAVTCGLHRWQWLPELLQLFGDDRAERIKALVRAQPEHGAGVRHALIDLLGERLLAGGMVLRFDAGAEGAARGARRRASRGPLGRVFGRLTNWLL